MVRAIDPRGCGCTECLTGEYVPLDRADDIDLLGLLLGHFTNNTGLSESEIYAEAVRMQQEAEL